MVDAARPHRRWLLRRLLGLAPLVVLGVAANVRVAMDVDRSGWLFAVSLVLSTLCLGGLAYLVLETLACAALQKRGERRAARVLRGQVAAHGPLAAVCLLVLCVVVLAPALLPARAASRRDVARRRRPAVETPPPATAFAADVEPLPVDAPAPRPQIVPEVADVPRRLEIAERELDFPLAAAPFLQPPEPPQEPSRTPDAELPSFRPERMTTDALLPREDGVAGVDRRGRPEDEATAPPPSARLELLLLDLDGYGRGSAVQAELDAPLSAAGSLRGGVLAVLFADGDTVHAYETMWSWTRLSAGYAHRLTGGMRRSALDLTVSAGLALDTFAAENDAAIDPRGRLSPVVALDVGLWQAGQVGILLHGAHGLATNLTGSTSSVTDASVTVRADLSERWSLHVGYRLLIVELREYDDAIVHEGGHKSFDDRLAGPLAGVEVRF